MNRLPLDSISKSTHGSPLLLCIEYLISNENGIAHSVEADKIYSVTGMELR